MSETDLVSSTAAPAPRKRGGLTGMVLAELRQLAAELNISGTAGMRKGDLIAAIRERQGGAAAAPADQAPDRARGAKKGADQAELPLPVSPAADAPAADAPAADAPVATSPAANGAPPADKDVINDAAPAEAPAPRRRRAASRPAGAPRNTEPAASPEPAPSTPDVAAVAESATTAGTPTTNGDGADHAADHAADSAADSAAVAESAAPVADAGSNGSVTTDGTAPAGSETVGRRSRQRRNRVAEQAETPAADAAAAPATEPATEESGDDRPQRGRGNGRTEGRPDNRAEGRTEGRTDSRPEGRTDNRPEGRTDNRADSRPDSRAERTDNRGGSRSDNRADSRSDNRADSRGPRDNRPDDGDDDGDGRGRRGRRFRDRRRGRDRERGTTGSTGSVDTEVRDGDVLLPVAGIVDILDNYAFVRTTGYLSSQTDCYVSLSLVNRYGLRRGDAITGAAREQREGENSRQKFDPLVRVDTVNGRDPETARNRPEFTKLTPLYPNERLRLETEPHKLTTRVIDLVMPVGKGQRALIVSPPKAGKTTIMQNIANAITTNNPECHLMVVLVDERPEEVTDMQRSVKGEVIASTFDRPPTDHTSIAELAIERAKRLVELGHDVVVLLDNITRLGRAYNLAAPASGRILSGGVDSTALYPPKRFLGAARNIEDGGSLTIFATALVETGSTMDTVIFEEFKGTGNAELKLDRKIADRRTFPAIDIHPSGTRKEELLMSPDEYAVMVKLRRLLSALDDQQAIDLLLTQLKKTRTNIEFLMQSAQTTPGE